MRQISNILNFLLIFPLVGGWMMAQNERVNQVTIQTYREDPSGQSILKDTVISVQNLDQLQHIVEQISGENINFDSLTYDKGKVVVKNVDQQGSKQIKIHQLQQNGLENLNAKDRNKLIQALQIAQIDTALIFQDAKTADSTAQPNVQIVMWDTASNQNVSEPISLKQSPVKPTTGRKLDTTLQNPVVRSHMQDMRIAIEIPTSPSPNTHKSQDTLGHTSPISKEVASPLYTISQLSAKDTILLLPHERLGYDLELGIDSLSLTPQQAQTYQLSLYTPQKGDLAVYMRNIQGNIIFQDLQKGHEGKYMQTLKLHKSLGDVLFLSIAQNAMINVYKLFIQNPTP